MAQDTAEQIRESSPKKSPYRGQKSTHYHVLRGSGCGWMGAFGGANLAALVTESPILLIGEHGTLNRWF